MVAESAAPSWVNEPEAEHWDRFSDRRGARGAEGVVGEVEPLQLAERRERFSDRRGARCPEGVVGEV